MTHDVGEDGRSFFVAAAAADASPAFFRREFLLESGDRDRIII